MCLVLMRLAEVLCLVRWSMALHTALWTGTFCRFYITIFARAYICFHLQQFRNDDLKALGVDDSKKLTEEQREELLQKVIIKTSLS